MSYTRGQETFWNTLVITFQNLCRLAWFSATLTLLISASLFYLFTPQTFWQAIGKGFDWFASEWRSEGILVALSKLGNLLDYLISVFGVHTLEIWASLALGLLLSFGFFLAAVIYFQRRGKKLFDDVFVSGARLITAAEYTTAARKLIRDQAEEVRRDTGCKPTSGQNSSSFDCSADGLKIPSQFLYNHTAAIGATGTGKSTVIKHMIEYSRSTGGKGIVLDVNGELYSQVGHESDVILGLFDRRTQFWDYAFEQSHRISISPIQIAEYLIPSSNVGEPIWWKGPRIILEDLLSQSESTSDLWNLIQNPSEDLVQHLVGGLAKKTAGKPDSKTAFSMVISTLLDCRYFGFLNHFAHDKSVPFSLLEWTQSKDPRWVFVVTDEKDVTVSQPLMRLWFNIAIHGILTRDPNNTLPPLAVIIDEMRSIGKLDILPSAVNRMRKYGGQGFFGYQSNDQLTQMYGQHDASSIKSGIGNRFVFNISNELEAESLASSFGKQEVKRKSFSMTYGVTAHGDRETLGEQIMEKNVVTSTDLSLLPNGHCYFKSRAINPVKTRIRYQQWSNRLPLHAEFHQYPDSKVEVEIPPKLRDSEAPLARTEKTETPTFMVDTSGNSDVES